MTLPGGIQKANHDDNDEMYRLGAQVRKAQDRPPAPVAISAINRETTVGVLRWIWTQPQPNETVPDNPVPIPYLLSQSDLSLIAARTAALPDPLRSLATTLNDIADQCAMMRMIPVGISVHMRHMPTSYAFLHLSKEEAAVADIAVTVVPHLWIQEQLHKRNQAEDGHASDTR